MSRLRGLAGGIGLLIAGAAGAQDLQGRDTAGNWRVTHYSSHGIWNTICDEREEQGALKRRCYIRWVDVYAEAPAFGAMFTFVTPRGGAGGRHDVMFGPEPGTAFAADGFRIDRDGRTVWQMQDRRCLLWADCSLDAEESAAVLQAMQQGGVFHFEFTGRHGRRFNLAWPLEGFAEAFETYEQQWRQRQ
ncbi:hypothetical protein RA19_19025 [Leisingera sp. ANG-M1]|uniref:invasion associated locus B family protein n=1 Tax=Leisingera sp. ANG-M1 TaxID=1577895 RepID=UPI00057CD31E|nr:invasion associated locus B family protein [Leisingera sp. ANG-M1]KIC08557.1 hypothetical protein RA19_19025 [Leisingera sp. ANG-M1]